MHLQTQTNIWQPFLQAVERRLGKQAVATWFRPLKVSNSSTPGVLIIAAPNTVVRDWILSNYAHVLNESLREIAIDSCRIQWTVLPFQSRADSEEISEPVRTSSKYQVHIRNICRRFVQPIRPRRGQGSRRDARQDLQPSLPLRWCRSWQDPPSPSGGSRDQTGKSQFGGNVRFSGAVHE